MADHRNADVRALVRDSGLSERTLNRQVGFRVFRTFDNAVDRIPDSDHIRRVAEALGVDVYVIVEAALAHAGLPLRVDYDPEQHRAARLVGQIPAGRRGRFVDGVEAMLDAFGITRESTRGSEELF